MFFNIYQFSIVGHLELFTNGIACYCFMAYPGHKDLRIKYNQTFFEADLIFNALHSICFLKLVNIQLNNLVWDFLGGEFLTKGFFWVLIFAPIQSSPSFKFQITYLRELMHTPSPSLSFLKILCNFSIKLLSLHEIISIICDNDLNSL